MVRRKSDIEYKLSIAPHRDEITGEKSTVLLLETTRLFRSFRYEIIVHESISDHTIFLHIDGFHAPLLAMPSTGTAQWKGVYKNLQGTYELIIEKPDGEQNASTIVIGEDTIQVVKKPRYFSSRKKSKKSTRAFIEIVVLPCGSLDKGT
ncbi:MAG: hypothetical protein ACPL4I_07745 [Bacteroidota bacterium]